MTHEEKKAWLGKYAEAEREIDRITENIQKWASRRERMGGSIVTLPDGGDGDGSLLERATEKIAALQPQQTLPYNQLALLVLALI